MLRRLAVALAAVALLAGCGGGGTELTAEDSGKTVGASVGDTFTLRLDENVTTGYAWQITQETDDGVVRMLGSDYEAPDTDAVGAGGVREWRFEAVGEGRTTLSMEYRRPFGDEGAAESFSVTFDVT